MSGSGLPVIGTVNASKSGLFSGTGLTLALKKLSSAIMFAVELSG